MHMQERRGERRARQMYHICKNTKYVYIYMCICMYISYRKQLRPSPLNELAAAAEQILLIQKCVYNYFWKFNTHILLNTYDNYSGYFYVLTSFSDSIIIIHPPLAAIPQLIVNSNPLAQRKGSGWQSAQLTQRGPSSPPAPPSCTAWF